MRSPLDAGRPPSQEKIEAVGLQQQQQQQQSGQANHVQNQRKTGVVSACPPSKDETHAGARNNNHNHNNNNGSLLTNSLVRVGEKVSFSTIVEAVLIPSISDIDAQSKRDIWWQAPDYTEFRKNYVRFIRTPSVEDDPDWEAAPTADPVASPTSVSVSPLADVQVAPLAANDNRVQDAVLVVASAAVSSSSVVHSVAHDKQQMQQQQQQQQLLLQARASGGKHQPQQQQHGRYNKNHEQMYRPSSFGGYDDCRKKQGVYSFSGQDGGITNANYRKQQQQQQQQHQAVRSPSFNGQSAYHRDGSGHGLEKVYPNPNPHLYYNTPRVNVNVNSGHNGGHHGNMPMGNMNRPYAVVDFRGGMHPVVAHGATGRPMPPTAYEAARRGQIQHRVQHQQHQHQYHQQGQPERVMMPGFSMWRGPVMYAPAGVYQQQQSTPVNVMRQ